MASFLFPCCIYLVIAMTAAQVTCPGNTMCAAGWKPHCASCYLFVTTKVNQTTARSECASKGCHLAYINNQRENSFIASNIIDESWIGLTTANVGNVRQCNGNTACNRQNWTWQDNQDVNFTNWASSEPTGDSSCVRMLNDGAWADRGCDVEYLYVCENSSSTTTAAPISTSTASTATPIPATTSSTTTTTPSTTTTATPTTTTTTTTTSPLTTTTTTTTTTTPTTTTTTPTTTTTTPTTTTTTPTTTTTTPTTTTTTPTTTTTTPTTTTTTPTTTTLTTTTTTPTTTTTTPTTTTTTPTTTTPTTTTTTPTTTTTTPTTTTPTTTTTTPTTTNPTTTTTTPTTTTTTPTTTTTTPTTTTITPTTTTTTPTTTTTTTTTPTTTTTTPTTTTTTPAQPPSPSAPDTLTGLKTSSDSDDKKKLIYVIVAGCVGLIVVIGVVMIIVYIQTKRENDRAFKRQTSSGEMSLEKRCDDMDENAVDGEDTEYDDHLMPGEYLSSPNDLGSVEAVQAASNPEVAVIVYPEGVPALGAEAGVADGTDTSLPESEQQGTNMQPTVTQQTVEGNHNVAPMEVIEDRGVDSQPEENIEPVLAEFDNFENDMYGT